MNQNMGELGAELKKGPQTLTYIEGDKYSVNINGKKKIVFVSSTELLYMNPRYPDKMTFSNFESRPYSTDVPNRTELDALSKKKNEVGASKKNLESNVAAKQKLEKLAAADKLSQSNLKGAKIKGMAGFGGLLAGSYLLRASDDKSAISDLRALENSFVDDGDYVSLTDPATCLAKLKQNPKLHLQVILELGLYDLSIADQSKSNSNDSDASSLKE